jgi:RHS repeat-associated protein
VNYDHFSPGKPSFELLEAAEQTEIGEESNIYFYHSDHLGSSSFLTDGSGFATQHLQYLPFGEDLVHQQNTAAYYTPYTFSSKERDVETGLSYFGARYYDAGLSIWLSVDPMSDKAPGWTPYRYGFQNPVKYIDPTGLLESEIGGDPPKKAQTQPSLDGIGFKPPQNLPLENTPLTGSTPIDNVVVAPTSIKPTTGTKTSSLSMEKLAYADPVAAIMVLSDYQKTKLPEGDPNRMTTNQFAYNLTSIGASVITSSWVGGPQGILAGSLVGGTFWAGEQLYDGINWGIGEISNGVSNFENALNQGWIPKGF